MHSSRHTSKILISRSLHEKRSISKQDDGGSPKQVSNQDCHQSIDLGRKRRNAPAVGSVSPDDETFKRHKVTTKTFIKPSTKRTTTTQGVLEQTLQHESNQNGDAELLITDGLSKSFDEKEESAIQSLRMLGKRNGQALLMELRNGEQCPQIGAKGESWSDRFAELQEYKRIHGHCDVSGDKSGLGAWALRQRQAYRMRMNGRSSNLTSERLEALNSIGFVWDCSSTRWSQRFNELLRYKEAHGNCRVPSSYKENVALGTWVGHQRSEYSKLQKGKQSSLTQARLEKLEALDFDFQVKSAVWSQRLDELIRYKEIYGNDRVPRTYEEIPGLGVWVGNQRTAYKKFQAGKPSSLTQERVEKLETIGFQWQIRVGNRGWPHMFDELVRYKEIHGDCAVSESYKDSPGLANWVRKQRAAYIKVQDGKHSPLTQERIGKLEAIGFQWQIRVGNRGWPHMFDELVRYKEIHGDCAVSESYKDSPGLAKWVSKQRAAYSKVQDGKHSPLTQERIEKLEAIGFQWRLKSTSLGWSQRFDDLVRYNEIHGNCLVPTSYEDDPDLGGWVKKQRMEFKKLLDGKPSTLTQECVEKLEAIGFQWRVLARRETGWLDMFHKLVRYKEIHGNCLVHQHYNVIPGLAQWVKTQRAEYGKLQDGKQSGLTQERREKLEAVGFQWQVSN